MTAGNVSAPFGSRAKRFLYVGYHPNLEYRPGTHKLSKVAPGCYENATKRKPVTKVSSWKRELALSEFSKRVGYHDECVKRREWLKSINGPGWQDVPTSAPSQGLGFPVTKRFSDGRPKSYSVPGPGTYGKNHVPHLRHEEKSLSKGFSFSTLPSFEQSSRAPRSLSIQLAYHLPPNLYKVKSGTEELLSKRVSKRGPYDLFSVERFPDPIVNKQQLTLQKIQPSSWNHPKNSFKGKFSRCGRENQVTSRLALMSYAWCKRNSLDPGPSHYNPYPTPVVRQAVAPFNTSSLEVRPIVNTRECPPVWIP